MNPFSYLHALDHHAYFIHSFKDSVHTLKEFLLEKFQINHKQNPDFFYEKFETLGIDDSRRIKEIHLSKSLRNDSKKIFIIETSSITHEAQNSLLKIFEEPNEGNHFFLIMPTYHTLLPTLRSRLSILKSGDDIEHGIEIIEKVEMFLKLSKKDKVGFMEDLAKDLADEKISKSEIIEFLSALEVVLYRKNGLKEEKALKSILKAREYMNDRSPSVKQLLTFVAIVMN
jgi:DNA polymerase III delta prime subunit